MTAFYHFQTQLFKIESDPVLHCYFYIHLLRGTQRQFLENICLEDDWDPEFSEHLLQNFLLACLS